MKLVLATILLTGCLMPPQSGQQPASAGDPSSPDPTGDPSASGPPPSSHSSHSSSASRPTPASTGPQTVSVTIRSACSKTAKVFFGDKPGFSSGTQSSISSNSVQSKTFKVGDQMWVTDDSNKGLDGVRIEASTRNIEIDSSCSRLSMR